MKTKSLEYILFIALIFTICIAFFISARKSEQSLINNTSVTIHQRLSNPQKNKIKKLLKDPQLVLAKTSQLNQGLTLIPRFDEPKITLVDNQGKAVHSWDINARRARLMSNCNLAVVHQKYIFYENGKKRNTWRLASEYNWNGKLVKEHRVSGEIHHDLRILKNNHLLLLHRLYKKEAALNHKNFLTKYPKLRVTYDAIKIIDPVENKTTYEWNFLDSFKADGCGDFKCPWESTRFLKAKYGHIDWTHVNSVSEIPENRWFKRGHLEFKPGNLMITSKSWSAILILDKESKKIVWQYGGEKLDRFAGGHEAHIIPPEFPGAGNILFFDNGDYQLGGDTHNGISIVKEFNPITKEIIWSFDNNKKLFTLSMGSAQRLRNGNTLISEDDSGKILEVTPDKEIVWHYETNQKTSRAYRYELDHCPNLNLPKTHKQ